MRSTKPSREAGKNDYPVRRRKFLCRLDLSTSLAVPRISRNAFSFLLLEKGGDLSLARPIVQRRGRGTERNGTVEKLISILFSICQDFPAARVYKRPSLLSPLNYSLRFIRAHRLSTG